MQTIIILFVLVIIINSCLSYFKRKRRQTFLLKRHGNLQLVKDIMAGKIWQGMTKEQLIDSWGQPEDQGQRVMKTKTTTTYKYDQTGRNRFQSRVILENDVVVGWQQK